MILLFNNTLHYFKDLNNKFMEILNWKISSELKKEIDRHYRTDFARSLKDSNPKEIIDQITFDGVAPNLKLEEVENLINYINRKFLKDKIKGVGLEVGSGPGFFSAIFAKNKDVEKIYAVEACENIVRGLMPKVTSFILGNDSNNKVIGCIGDFNHLELKDNSIDFVFDFYSLHHSEDLQKTLIEIYRILKPGGFIVCLDKARGDYLTDKDIEKMLNKEYSTKTKELMGVNPKVKLTRKMNGEKEFRLKDWSSNFTLSGFSKFEHYNIARCANNNKIVRKVKEIFSLIIPKIQIIFTSIILKPKKVTVNNLSSKNRVYTTLIDNFPKEISLMIGYK